MSRMSWMLATALLPLLQAQTAPTSNALPKWAFGPFVREDSVDPILQPLPDATFQDPMRKVGVQWERDNTFNPAAVERKGKLVVLYRAEDDSGQGIGFHTSRIGLAESRDGLHYYRLSQPVLFPADDAQKEFDWPGGCEDPRVVEGPSGYVMTYTAWNRKTARLSEATSKDLVHWVKRGPVFGKADGGKYRDMWSKSGAIVTRQRGDHFEAVKIQGKYWMYWGDGPVGLASSTNLVDWKPYLTADSKPEPMLAARPHKFDSGIAESGPPAVLTPDGIVLIYNGMNAAKDGDPGISPGAYSAGEALFDARNPAKLLQRLDEPFFRPARPYEVTGQYKSGTVFVEGLASFHGKLWLFYGAADSKVGVATAPEVHSAIHSKR